MDFDSTLSTIESYVPDEIIDSVMDAAAAYIPAEVNFGTMMKFLLFFSLCSLILGVLGRMFLGKRSSLNHAVSSTMGILFVYAVTVVVYTFHPWKLELLLSPLPFVTFSGEYLIVFPILDAQFPALCTQVLSLIILAFLMNLLDTVIPKGKTVISWFLLRFLAVGLAMVFHLMVDWAFRTYLPDVLVTYAPMILLILLIFMILMGLANLFLSLILTAVNPFIGAMYAFFFSSAVGKQLTKAVFTTSILCAVVFLMGYFGYTVICISGAALAAYIPFALVMLLLWYLIGHVL